MEDCGRRAAVPLVGRCRAAARRVPCLTRPWAGPGAAPCRPVAMNHDTDAGIACAHNLPGFREGIAGGDLLTRLRRQVVGCRRQAGSGRAWPHQRAGAVGRGRRGARAGPPGGGRRARCHRRRGGAQQPVGDVRGRLLGGDFWAATSGGRRLGVTTDASRAVQAAAGGEPTTPAPPSLVRRLGSIRQKRRTRPRLTLSTACRPPPPGKRNSLRAHSSTTPLCGVMS